eukprot:COSAG02_NODE_3216_length_7160_cov_11.806260_4_plen_150_part_00
MPGVTLRRPGIRVGPGAWDRVYLWAPGAWDRAYLWAPSAWDRAYLWALALGAGHEIMPSSTRAVLLFSRSRNSHHVCVDREELSTSFAGITNSVTAHTDTDKPVTAKKPNGYGRSAARQHIAYTRHDDMREAAGMLVVPPGAAGAGARS